MIQCPACSNEIADDLYIRVYFSSYTKTTHRLYHCSMCNIEFWHPREIMTDIYESEHYGAYTEFHEGKRSLPQWCKPFFDKFPLKRGRLLDIGCGDGIFLKHAEELGFEIWGIDFDKRSIENARRRFGFNNLYTKTLEEFVSYAETNDLSFDVITFFEVLEHQGRPLEFINNVRKVLKADGYIAGSVPNRERLFAEADRRLFMADYPPHHFLWFSKEAIRMFFVNNNFQSVALFPVKLNIVRISEWLESVMLGKLSKEIKKRLMASLFRQYVKDERDLGKTVETFELLYGKDKKTVFLKFLRGIRNLFFLPIGLIFYHAFNKRGSQLYFQAELRR